MNQALDQNTSFRMLLRLMGADDSLMAYCRSYSIPSIIGLIYFATQRKGSLYFVKPKMDIHVITKSCSNGASEMVSTLANRIKSA